MFNYVRPLNGWASLSKLCHWPGPKNKYFCLVCVHLIELNFLIDQSSKTKYDQSLPSDPFGRLGTVTIV